MMMVDTGTIGKVDIVISRDRQRRAHHMTLIMMDLTSSIKRGQSGQRGKQVVMYRQLADSTRVWTMTGKAQEVSISQAPLVVLKEL